MSKIRVLHDYSDDEYPAIEAGTIVENADIDPENGDAWYDHPDASVEWISLEGDFEVIDDE